MQRQLKLARDMVNLYFKQQNKPRQLTQMLQMQACMEDMNDTQQTEYLLAWLRDRGVAVDVSERTVELVQEIA